MTRPAIILESSAAVTFQSVKPEGRSVVVRFIIAVVVGLAIAIGGTILVVNVVSSHGNSTPSNSSVYNYGSR